MNKNIRLSPKRLDDEADHAFRIVRMCKEKLDLRHSVTTDFINHHTLAGCALRRWAIQMRKARKAKKSKS